MGPTVTPVMQTRKACNLNGIRIKATSHTERGTSASSALHTSGKRKVQELRTMLTRDIAKKKIDSLSTGPRASVSTSRSANQKVYYDIESYPAEERRSPRTSTGNERSVCTVKSGVAEKSWPVFAAMRAAAKAAKLTKVYVEGESEEENDDWLDDEQWYCENAAEWSDRPLIVGPEVYFKDAAALKKALEDHFHDELKREITTLEE